MKPATMKPQTRTADLQKLIAKHEAEAAAEGPNEAAREALARIVAADTPGPALLDPLTLSRAKRANVAAAAAAESFAKLPASRRTLAGKVKNFAEAYANSAARSRGGDYSGETKYRVQWPPADINGKHHARAYTLTDQGGAYSRSCKYSKTDATHVVTLDPARVHCLYDAEPLRQMSAADGLPLIALDEDGACVWVKSSGKQIVSESGWLIGDEVCCYHSTKSREDAVKGHTKKRAKLDAERTEREARQRATTPGTPEYVAAQKADRRARLIARLCGSVVATIADARKLGYCGPGIAAFQRAHGIGDTAPLPALIRTADPAAVRLALSIARNVKKAA